MKNMKNTCETRAVKIDALITENLQIRVEMLEECVRDYAEIYREDPQALPPVTVFYDVMGDAYYLADGFHRVAAAKLNGRATVLADVYEGTFDDALRYALKANAKNGIHRTNADKLHALEIVWAQWDTLYKSEKRTTKDGRPSKRQLMSLCRVTDHLALTFLQNKRVVDSTTPEGNTVSNGALGDRALPDSVGADHRAARADRSPDATTVTSDHLEERNESIRELLKQGKDRYGVAIPEKIMPAFLSCEPRKLMRTLGEVRNFLEKRRLAGDIAFAHSVAYAMRDLDATIRDLRHGAVHCVCRMCRGRGCGSCSDLGFQTRLQYDRVPAEYKAETK